MLERRLSDHTPREMTPLAVALGLVLAVIMGAANTYLGLKAGMTVSASIPAAVISMALLRGLLRRGTILENNIVQTMASTGESLAAGAIFTIPAFILVGEWQEFRFWPTTCIVMFGGALGVAMMVPLRRALIVERKDLVYPEGVACAEVLIVGQTGGSGVKAIAAGLGVGAVFKFLNVGLGAVRGVVEGAAALGKSVFYMGADMSLALVAVGYIVRLNIASLIFMGGALAWLIALPLLGGYDPSGEADAAAAAWSLWSTKIRYIGVGAMLLGGVHSIWRVRAGILAGLGALRGAASDQPIRNRADRDMPLYALASIFVLSVFGTFVFYDFLVGQWGVALAATGAMTVAAFIFVAVATYIVGLVGSSNSPVSGMTICALLMTAGVLLALGIRGESAIMATLGVAGVVCCATCTAGDIAQDLKTGSLIGATPFKQQSAEFLAVAVPAFFVAPVLTVLHKSYGIATGAEGSLSAPQATLFASLTQGFFGGGALPWRLIAIGAAIGVALIVLNGVLERAGASFRAHVMPVAVGMYLPLALVTPIFIGGLLRYIIERKSPAVENGEHNPGVLFGSGLIAGEALMAILIGILLYREIALPKLGTPMYVSVLLFAAALLTYAIAAKSRRGVISGRH